jgi:hypothetical protein
MINYVGLMVDIVIKSEWLIAFISITFVVIVLEVLKTSLFGSFDKVPRSLSPVQLQLQVLL